MSGEIPVRCPLTNEPVHEFQPCDLAELDALVDWLGRQLSEGGRREFPRGIVENGRLDLCKQAIGPQGAKRVLDSLDGHPTIRSILFGTDRLRDEGACIVAGAMRRNRHLETIYLGCNGITAAGLDALCSAIEEDGCGTRALWLKRNPLGGAGAERLEQLLLRRHSLRTLDLVNTGIGDEGACRIIASIIQAPQHIERIYLGGNGLTVASATVAARMIEQCPGVTAVYLGTNFLYDAGASVLAPSLRINRTLRELSVAANGLTAGGVSAVCSALYAHPCLEFLDLGSSPSARILGAPANTIDSTEVEALVQLVGSLPRLGLVNLRGNALDSTAANKILDACEGRRHPSVIRLDGNPCNRRVRQRAAMLAARALPRVEPADLCAIRSVAR